MGGAAAPGAARDAQRGWRDEGWLRTIRGTVWAAVPSGAGLLVDLATDEGSVTVSTDRIVLCTGAEADVRRFEDPLWRALLARGYALADPLGLGVLTGPDGAVRGADGGVPSLWAIGGLRRPERFESTSVPDLSVQARDLALALTTSDVGLQRPASEASHGGAPPSGIISPRSHASTPSP